MGHLTVEERETLMVMQSRGCTQKLIAQELGRSEGTISRELRRNRDEKGNYHCLKAQRFANERKAIPRRPAKMEDPETFEAVIEKLEDNWSPEQITGHFRCTGVGPVISHQTIYNYLNCLPRNHPHRRAMRRRGRRNRQAKPGFLKRLERRRSIHERPKISNERRRMGDWELDLMVCGGRSGYLITAVERKTGYTKIRKVRNKEAGTVTDGIIRMFDGMDPSKLKTFTFDNGTEFYYTRRIEEQLQVKTYFADPYNSGQRGTNENTNGLIRQYFPKDLHYGLISYWDVRRVERMLNERPRLRLRFETPAAAFGV